MTTTQTTKTKMALPPAWREAIARVRNALSGRKRAERRALARLVHAELARAVRLDSERGAR